MSMQTTARGSRLTSAMSLCRAQSTCCIALIVLGACANEPQQLVNPSLPMTPRFAGISSGHGGGVTIASIDVPSTVGFAGICVSATSPFGDYVFSVVDYSLAAGGSTLLSLNPGDNTLRPGNCVAVAARFAPADLAHPANDPMSSVTYAYTGNYVRGGVNFSGVTCHDDLGNPLPSVCPVAGLAAPTVIGGFNFVLGTFATFSFVQTPPQMIAGLRIDVQGWCCDIFSDGTKHQMEDRLREVAKDVGKGQTSHACKELDHFIKFVTADTGKKIGNTAAAYFTSKANNIQVALGC